MHFSSIPLSLAALAPLANAFPAAIMEAAASDPALLARAAEMAQQLKGRQAGADAATAIFEPIPIFNEKAQFINVTKGSGHEYVAPGPNDLRGPCPGLNAFANHSVYTSSILSFLIDRTRLPTTQWICFRRTVHRGHHKGRWHGPKLGPLPVRARRCP